MKNIVKSVLLVLIGLVSGLLITNNVYCNCYSSNVVSNTTITNLVKSNSIAMMLETDIDSNEYYLSTDTSWPQSGYVFNESLSKCENGATLSWDSDNNQVLMTGSSSDKCYIYFDIISKIDEVCDTGDNLSNCIQELFSETGEGTVGIYYHDGTGDYTNAELEAGDYSYRYAGASDSTYNFVCLGSDSETCETDSLYRIVGLFKNDSGSYEVKLIKYDYATTSSLGTTGDYYDTYSSVGYTSSYYLGSISTTEIGVYYWNYVNYSTAYSANGGYYNDWSYSQLNTINLNTNYYNSLDSKWQNMISEHTWIVGGNTPANMRISNALTAYDAELVNYETSQVSPTYSDKIGLMYLSDYYYSADPTYWSYPGYTSSDYPDSDGNYGDDYDYRAATTSNWLYMGLFEWIITRSLSYSFYAFYLRYTGEVNNNDITHGTNAIRPTFYLLSSIKYVSGSGTQSDPIIISL